MNIGKRESNKNRLALINKFASKRAELKAMQKLCRLNKDQQGAFNVAQQLAKLHPNSSRVRYRNRCTLTNRARGFRFYNIFGLSNLALYINAKKGLIPGVRTLN